MTMLSDGATNTRTYDAVNEAVNRVIFDGRHKLAPVYLDLEGSAAEELSELLDIPAADCLNVVAAAVAKSLTWNRADPFSWHIGELVAWTSLDRFGAPPFTALLSVLTVAAERMRADEVYSEQNYYERLFEVLGVDNDTRKNSLRQNSKSTKQFWDALNLWLAQNDFDFGRPTAKRINKWPYVSFALSQAMMREGDRRRLHDLFVEYGLAPHEQLTDAEMTLYLHEWMRSEAPSKWLKRIWATPDLRNRVAAAACAELEAWDGAGDLAEQGNQRRRLSWAVSLQVFPRRELRMFMSAANADDGGQLNLSLPKDAAPAALAAFERCIDNLWLSPTAGGEISVLEPVREIALSPLMLASFALDADRDRLSFHKAARPIIPLIKLDTGAFYREVSRISFLRPHLVLCHAKWGDRVVDLLSLNARQGFVRWTPESLNGLPADWLLFSGVEMLRPPSAVNSDLQALVPLSEGVSVEMTGGLRLSQNLWHAAAPPEITAAAPTGPLRLVLKDAAGVVAAEKDSKGSSCRLTLSRDRSWENSNFTLAASVDMDVKSEIQVSFRSAEQPRRLSDLAQDAGHFFSPNDPRGFFTADRIGDADRPFVLRGMATWGERITELNLPSAPANDLILATEADEEFPAELEQTYHLESVNGLQETCVLRGHHYWICEPFHAGEDPRDDKWMACNSCKNRVLTRNRGAVQRQKVRRAFGQAPRVKSSPPMHARVTYTPSADLILDALSYLGSGSWRKLQDLTSSDGQSLLGSQKMSAALIALGHIDVIYDERLRSPQSWIVAPPALVFTPRGAAFLAGFRNAALVKTISERLETAGAILEIKNQESAPAAYIWSRLSPAIAEASLAGVCDAHGRQIVVSKGFTAAVAANAPNFSHLMDGMPAIHLGNPKDLQRFDPASGSWRTVIEIGTQGAYRGDFGGRRYIYRDAAGLQREGTFSVVKLLAARAEGLMLHGYDPLRGIFKAVLGCEPPGLFVRALVASSGLMPEHVDQQLHFRGVVSKDAEVILSKLYS